MNTPSTAVRSLPRQTTTFIGRQHEIAEIIALLDNPACQLLTLLGPGGVGKTRLAIEIAQQLSAAYVDGVYYVALQLLRSADQILHAIINSLGLEIRHTDTAQQQLLWYLGDKYLLACYDGQYEQSESLLQHAEAIGNTVGFRQLAADNRGRWAFWPSCAAICTGPGRTLVRIWMSSPVWGRRANRDSRPFSWPISLVTQPPSDAEPRE